MTIITDSTMKKTRLAELFGSLLSLLSFTKVSVCVVCSVVSTIVVSYKGNQIYYYTKTGNDTQLSQLFSIN